MNGNKTKNGKLTMVSIEKTGEQTNTKEEMMQDECKATDFPAIASCGNIWDNRNDSGTGISDGG